MQQPVKATDYVGQAIRRYWRIGVPNIPSLPAFPAFPAFPALFCGDWLVSAIAKVLGIVSHV
jgi:hypothetical protein